MPKATSVSFKQSITAVVINTALAAANVSAVIAPSNVNRKGLIIYNNTANSIYVCLAGTANASLCAYIVPSFTSLPLLMPVCYTGVLSAIKNAGTTGTVVVHELV